MYPQTILGHLLPALERLLPAGVAGAVGGAMVYIFKALFDHRLALRRETLAQQNRRALQHEEFAHSLRLAAVDRRLQAHQQAVLTPGHGDGAGAQQPGSPPRHGE